MHYPSLTQDTLIGEKLTLQDVETYAKGQTVAHFLRIHITHVFAALIIGKGHTPLEPFQVENMMHRMKLSIGLN